MKLSTKAPEDSPVTCVLCERVLPDAAADSPKGARVDHCSPWPWDAVAPTPDEYRARYGREPPAEGTDYHEREELLDGRRVTLVRRTFGPDSDSWWPLTRRQAREQHAKWLRDHERLRAAKGSTTLDKFGRVSA